MFFLEQKKHHWNFAVKTDSNIPTELDGKEVDPAKNMEQSRAMIALSVARHCLENEPKMLASPARTEPPNTKLREATREDMI